jgi:hypothetical protein
MFDRNSLKNIWVSPNGSDNGNGNLESPYSSISTALDKALAGSTIVCMPGDYKESISINNKNGTQEDPITICGDPTLPPAIFSDSWYLYEVSDFIVSDLTFINSANSAVSLVGKSERNIFKNLIITNCGEKSECAIFLGGSDGVGNIIEQCQISYSERSKTQIGVMVSQSRDIEDQSSRISQNAVVRYSTFTNCGTAIILGSSDELEVSGNHLVDENLFENCYEGVRIKSIGTTISESIFRNCENGISHSAGVDTYIRDNRFEECRVAISAAAADCTIHDSLFVDSPILIESSDSVELPIIIHNITSISNKESEPISLATSDEVMVVLSNNIFIGTGPTHFDGLHTTGNIGSDNSGLVDKKEIKFEDTKNGNYSQDEFDEGAHGTVTSKLELILPAAIDIADLAKEHHHGSEEDVVESDQDKRSMDERDLYLKTLYINNSADEDEEKEDDGHTQLHSMQDGYDEGLIE